MQQDNSEQVIIDPVLIAKHYIRTWFFLDLLSSIPLDYIFLIFNAGRGDVSTIICIHIMSYKGLSILISTSFIINSQIWPPNFLILRVWEGRGYRSYSGWQFFEITIIRNVNIFRIRNDNNLEGMTITWNLEWH